MGHPPGRRAEGRTSDNSKRGDGVRASLSCALYLPRFPPLMPVLDQLWLFWQCGITERARIETCIIGS
ncbi:hypothetical protein NDU88_002605 [Pleurodeles waltl]|uniref:Uncharacterized protein n=1 Tax=Pleurodeles waltl TaxID=8319 RepID=A0AAV7LEM7_PLEWA|nr:hypothetical protein NDU88_002605 [Pleurodeles waltl]